MRHPAGQDRRLRTPTFPVVVVVVVVLGVALTVLAALTSGPASAVDPSKGTPGFCPTGQGVTVVVDFQQLGGETIVRCFPSTGRATGLDALKGAGFQIAGVQRWGESFICRIENRPSAVETVPIAGNPGYQERCVDTPPASGYWSYWHAGNGCAWDYSQWGVKNRDVIPGGFEGWSFSLNASADDNPEPRVAPVRPGNAGQPCGAPAAPGPSSDDPDEQQAPTTAAPVPAPAPPPVTAAPAPGGPWPGSPSTGAAPTAAAADPTATSSVPEPATGGADESAAAAPPGTTPGTALDPNRDVEFTGGENAANVSDVLREQSGSSPLAPVVAVAVVAALVAGSVVVSRRRRSGREP